jgi:hypothetical protein
MIWGGEYVEGDEYKAYTQVQVDGWLMTSNKSTSDYPAPQPIGEPFYVYDGPELDAKQETTKSLVFGMRYLNVTSNGYIKGYRIQTIIGNRYTVYSVRNPTSNPVIGDIITFDATSDGWQEFNLSGFLPTGTEFDLVVVAAEPDPTPSTIAYNWDYVIVNSVTPPLSGQVTHATKAKDVISINDLDDVGADRSGTLSALTPGDIISIGDQRWSIQDSKDQGDYWDFYVAPATQWTTVGVQLVTFEIVTPVPVTYHDKLDYWVSDPNVSGLINLVGDYGDVTVNNTQYGIDIKVQEASISPDWDFAAFTGSASGGYTPLPPAVFGELSTSTTTTQKTFTGTPSPYEGFYDLVPGSTNDVTLVTGASPTANGFTIEATGVYCFMIDLSIDNAATGGTRVYQVTSFVNGTQTPSAPQEITIETADTVSLAYSGLAELSEGQTLDIRMRKLSGTDVTIDLQRINFTLFRISGTQTSIGTPFGVYRINSTQSVPTDTNWRAEFYETIKENGITHTTGTALAASQFFVTRPGWYAVNVEVRWAATATADMRYSYFIVGDRDGFTDPRYGRTILRAPGQTTTPATVNEPMAYSNTCFIPLIPGNDEYLQLVVRQSTGAALDLSSTQVFDQMELSIAWSRPL